MTYGNWRINESSPWIMGLFGDILNSSLFLRLGVDQGECEEKDEGKKGARGGEGIELRPRKFVHGT